MNIRGGRVRTISRDCAYILVVMIVVWSFRRGEQDQSRDLKDSSLSILFSGQSLDGEMMTLHTIRVTLRAKQLL